MRSQKAVSCSIEAISAQPDELGALLSLLSAFTAVRRHCCAQQRCAITTTSCCLGCVFPRFLPISCRPPDDQQIGCGVGRPDRCQCSAARGARAYRLQCDLRVAHPRQGAAYGLTFGFLLGALSLLVFTLYWRWCGAVAALIRCRYAGWTGLRPLLPQFPDHRRWDSSRWLLLGAFWDWFSVRS